MSRTVKIEGLARLKKNLAEAGTKTREAAEQAVASEVDEIRDDARRMAPRKTGALRAGIRARANGLDGTVKSTVRYATFVEHGTYRDKAQPYMAPAAALARLRLPKRAADVIRVALKEIR